MKKFLTILSLSTILTTSFAIVSCKVSNSNQKINNKKEDSNKNNNKNIDNNKNKIEKTKDNSTNKNKLDKQKEFLNNWNKVFIDSPTGYDIALRLTKEQKAKIEKIDSAANDFKKRVIDLLEKKEYEELNFFSKELIFKNLNILLANSISKKALENEKKIKKLLDESKFEEIKREITINFSKATKSSKKITEENKNKLSAFLSEVKENNEEKIYEILVKLFEMAIKVEFDEKAEELSNSINYLINSKMYDKLKQKIFSLINETAKFEKSLIK
ncbi:MAG6090-like repeat-containing lipoprotein [Mycoplasma capricolum]|uniref:MAG6090-like repeat-containing lipoprotein n=1 Tax=Mycoplasma capricolum TaxID=2095 RepID=UPI0022F388C0|nr:hypothetical protein [Mycoplasma capricolum]WBX36169.1 hypothetical protein NO343_04405 [Mycoplasma capricolum subsp. capricolum]